ncbi:hypothetical protein L2D14_15785 [Thalassospiraceae bacterium LMO-JJ14]|nr:hypothetical protein L2D14_15785 [Thalassospiraceae bacterium LMO-JJ14]
MTMIIYFNASDIDGRVRAAESLTCADATNRVSGETLAGSALNGGS